MIDNTVARINVSLDKEHKEKLEKLRTVLEIQKQKRLPVAEVMREAIKIALKYA